MPADPVIRAVHRTFFRHDRWYCIFSLVGRDADFLYYAHTSRPLRSLMFGKDFQERLPELMEKEDLCIECGLGLAVAGGVALDGEDLIAWNCTVEEANTILDSLQSVVNEREKVLGRF